MSSVEPDRFWSGICRLLGAVVNGGVGSVSRNILGGIYPL